MNIAFIVASLANVGSISLVKDLSDNLTHLGHSCTVYYFDNKTEIKFICKTIRISFWRKFNFSDFDIVHSHCLRPNAYVFFHRKKRYKAKFLTTMHSYIKDDLIYNYNYITGLVFSFIWKILLIKQDLICCLSNNAKEYYQKILFKPKLEVVYSGRDISGIETEIDAKDKELFMRIKEKFIVIGINAVLTRIKGIEQIINLLQRDSQFACVIIGDGKGKKELEDLTKRLDVEDRCFFLGYRKEARRYLKFYDIYAMPSRFEGFPLALTEAVAHKVPCICSDIPIFKELYTDQEIICFKLDDINDLEKEIDLMKNSNTRRHFAERAFERYSRYYTVRAMTRRYLKVYESLIG